MTPNPRVNGIMVRIGNDPQVEALFSFEDQCVIMIQQGNVPSFEQWLLISGWLMIGSGIVCTTISWECDSPLTSINWENMFPTSQYKGTTCSRVLSVAQSC